MRRGGREPQPPGTEVPQDGGDQQREYHREARARADLQDQLDREQRDHTEGYGSAGEQHTDEVERARVHHRDVRRQGMGIDDRGDRVGGIVKAVDELECKRDKERHAKEEIGKDRRGAHSHTADIADQAVARIADPDEHESEEEQLRAEARLAIEERAGCGRRGEYVGGGAHGYSMGGAGGAANRAKLGRRYCVLMTGRGGPRPPDRHRSAAGGLVLLLPGPK
jgi:hypothetical protein